MNKVALAGALLAITVLAFGTMRAFAGGGGGTVRASSLTLQLGSPSNYYVYWWDEVAPLPDTINYAVTMQFDPAVIDISNCAGDPADSGSTCEQPDEGTLIFSSPSRETSSERNSWNLGQLTVSCREVGSTTVTIAIQMWESSMSYPAPTAVNGTITCMNSFPRLRATSAVGVIGETVSVNIDLLGMSEPGLGAWTVDVGHDPAFVSLVDCDVYGGAVCGPNYSATLDRFTGATRPGIVGDFTLATLTYKCRAPTSLITPIYLTTNVFSDADPENPRPIDITIANGSITCTEAAPTSTAMAAATATPRAAPLPSAGTGASANSTRWWLPAALLGGAAALATGWAYALRRRR